MRLLLYLIGIGAVIISSCSCSNPNTTNQDNREILAENDSVQILCEVVDSASDSYDVPVVALTIRKKFDGSEQKLLQTVKPDWFCWYMGDGDRFVEVPIDSIAAISRVFIYNDEPLQLIAQGCPDCRNEFSHFIDVEKRKAWYVPANSGYVGGTEEGYMIFRSYRYVSDPDIAGRYTFLQIFDENGLMVDSLDLEHIILEKYDSPFAKK